MVTRLDTELVSQMIQLPVAVACLDLGVRGLGFRMGLGFTVEAPKLETQ